MNWWRSNSSVTYESGYFYILKVKKTILANLPLDGSSRNYILIEYFKKSR